MVNVELFGEPWGKFEVTPEVIAFKEGCVSLSHGDDRMRGDPWAYRWQRLTDMFVVGHRRKRYDGRTVRGKVSPRKDAHVRGEERFHGWTDVPRMVLVARFAGSNDPEVDIIEPDSVQTEAGFNDNGDQYEKDETHVLGATSVSAGWQQLTIGLLVSPRMILFNLS